MAEWHDTISCPSTWTEEGRKLVPLPLAAARAIEAESLALSPTPWHRLLESLTVAWAFLRISKSDATEKIMSCYAMILPGFEECDVICTYRPALRHILDGFWAMLEWESKKTTPPLLQAFVGGITPFENLPPRQQAAVHAVRATVTKMQRDVALTHAQLAVEKGPAEGEWRYLLASCKSLPGSGASPAEVTKLLREAHRLRPGPHTAISLARQLSHKERWRAKELVDLALRQHPDSPYVLSCAGEVLVMIDGFNSATAAEWKGLLQRCSALVGETRGTELKLASICRRQGGREEEAKMHYEKARTLAGGQMPHMTQSELCMCCGGQGTPACRVKCKSQGAKVCQAEVQKTCFYFTMY